VIVVLSLPRFGTIVVLASVFAAEIVCQPPPSCTGDWNTAQAAANNHASRASPGCLKRLQGSQRTAFASCLGSRAALKRRSHSLAAQADTCCSAALCTSPPAGRATQGRAASEA